MRRNYLQYGGVALPLLPLIELLFLGCLAFVLLGCGKTGTEPDNYLIGVINPNKGTENITIGFIEGLASQGYVIGKNLNIIKALGGTDFDRIFTEMIKQDVDLLFTITTPATKKALAAIKNMDIPVVFALHDPVRSGIVKSLTAVKKNVTGIQIRGSIPKALDWLLTLTPAIDTIFVPVHFDTPATNQSLGDLRQAAQRKNIRLVVQEVHSVPDIEKVFQNLPEDVDAVFLVHSIFISSHTDQIVGMAEKYRLPVGGGISTYNKGALITFGVNHVEVGKQASSMAGQILQGTKTENIPIETAEFYLGINMETARMAGIKVSNTILSYADDIIPLKDDREDVKLNTQ
jgi:putative ABC transport system substrate-binding protein